MPSVAGGVGTSRSGGAFFVERFVETLLDPRDEVLLERLAFFLAARLVGFRAGVLAGFLTARFLAISATPP